MTTFPQLLSGLLATDPGRPLVTFYDDSTGERTELSVTTWANWVAKVASLLVEELDLEGRSRLLVDVESHWLGTVVLGAAWASGIEVVWDGEADAVVTGPSGLARWSAEADRIPVVATALQPLAGRFPDGVPPGVHDLGLEVWSQPDTFVAYPEPADDDAALAGVTHAQLWVRDGAGRRVLSQTNPASASGVGALVTALATGGSLVLVAHVSPDRLDAIASDEKVSERV
ncbi:MAG: TIGR03089 family protein [Nocardioides sp.]